jgi:hypothetical protein
MTTPATAAKVAPGADQKAAQFSESIIAGVLRGLAPQSDETIRQLASIQADLGAITARLEAMDSLASGTASKRAVRPAPKKAGEAATEGKISNSLLYFRSQYRQNGDDYRTKFGTPDNLAKAEGDEGVKKKPQGTDEYHNAVASFLWKSVLTAAQKELIKTEFNASKVAKAGAADEQLGEDGEAA